MIGTAVIVTGPGTMFEWLQYLYIGRKIVGISWDELPILRADFPGVVDERLPAHFTEQRPWRYEIEEHLADASQILVISPSINKANGHWHNEDNWRVRAVRIPGIPHTWAQRQRTILDALIANNLPEHIGEMQSLREKLYGEPPIQT